MTDPQPEQPDGPRRRADADIEDTQAFQAFVEDGQGAAEPAPVGAPFRIITLLAGLAAFAVIVVLLLR